MQEVTSQRIISTEKKGLGLNVSRGSWRGNQNVNFNHENSLTQSQRDSTKTIKLTEFALDICNVEKCKSNIFFLKILLHFEYSGIFNNSEIIY